MTPETQYPDFSRGTQAPSFGDGQWYAPVPNAPHGTEQPFAQQPQYAQYPPYQNYPNYANYPQQPMQQSAYPQQMPNSQYPAYPQDPRVPYSYQGWGTDQYDNSPINRRAAEEKARMQKRAQAQQGGPSSLGGSARRERRRAKPAAAAVQPAEQAQQAANPNQPGNPKNPKKGKKKTGARIKLALVLILLLALGITYAIGSNEYSGIQKAVAKYDRVFLDTVYVDGICLGGKTWEEGSKLISDHLNLKKNGWYVRIRNAAGEYNDITAETLGINFDATHALQQAWAVGRTEYSGIRGTLNRQKELERLHAQEYHFSSAEQEASSAPLDAILETLAAAAYREPQNAQVLGFDPDNTSNPFTYRYEVYGQRLNTEGIKEQIMDYAERLENGEVLLTVESVAPSVTVNDLCVAHELRAVAYTPISTHSTEDRTDNIRLAFSHINGLVLNDGERFSFNKTVGKRSIENGYKAAVEYQYGAEEWGIGGGVCQASTTLYLAAVNGGMTIKTRRPHSMAVSYTDLGLDCTVNDTRGHEIDFVFVNNTGGPVYLTAHVIGRNKKNYQCEVRIYGPSLGNKKYQLKAETIEILPKPYEPKMVNDKAGEYVTYVDETKTIEGRDGYKVQSYLVTYENGVEVGRKDMYLDTYPNKADTVYVGVTPRGGI